MSTSSKSSRLKQPVTKSSNRTKLKNRLSLFIYPPRLIFYKNFTINFAICKIKLVFYKSLESYERLEFLGDAVLELITSEYFYKSYDLEEGQMTKMRARYVCEHALYEYSRVVGFIPYIRVGKGQKKNVNETIIADVFEALLGAIFLECGLDVCRDYFHKVIVPFIESKTVFYTDYKSLLQEMVQTGKKSLEYRLTKEEGPAHNKSYTFEVLIDGRVYGKGTGKSKKDAEQKAAFDAHRKSAKAEEWENAT